MKVAAHKTFTETWTECAFVYFASNIKIYR